MIKLILFKHGGSGARAKIWVRLARPHAAGSRLRQLAKWMPGSRFADFGAPMLISVRTHILLALLKFFVDFVPASPWLLMLLLTVRNALFSALCPGFRGPFLLVSRNVLCNLVGLGLYAVNKL